MKKVVKILEGPFCEFHGVVKTATNETVTCLIPIFGMEKEVNVSANGVTFNVPSDTKKIILETYEKIHKSID